MTKSLWVKLGIVALVATIAAGCETFGRADRHYANSLFTYLYSDQAGHVDEPAIPVLSLPLRVGIAFVPTGDRAHHRYEASSLDEATFSEVQKLALMKTISAQFRAYPFIKSIELIPSAYLTPKGGFENLNQIRTMYGIDVMVLLSYDQVQFTDEGLLSLSYWTIVGAYVVEGEKNDTRTMLDAAVYDIASRKLLFRAPGIGDINGSATPVNLSEQLRRDRERGFQKAATNLVTNLKGQLEDFQNQVRQSPADYKVIHKPGYAGAASVSALELSFVGTLAIGFLWARRGTRS